LGPTGVVIPHHQKLKKVICLTKWHEEYFLERFPSFKGKTDSWYYGIDSQKFKPSKKVANSFIYSSFPNRGLLPLLQIWPYIKQIMPDATLNIYSDINGKWVNDVAKDQMDEIRRILATKPSGVFLHGWVSKAELADAWSRADIWLYPCIFQETFCLTALEAAASKTLAISIPLAALQETVGDRGILIPGNPTELEWQNQALSEILKLTQDTTHKNKLIERNYEWAQEHTWKMRGEQFIKQYLVSDADGLSYAEMYNWTHDLPSGSIHLFLEALAAANPKDILEIGTFAGTSLIKMLRLYPDAKGYAIDSWKNYKEDGAEEIMENIEKNQISVVFENNIKNAGLSDRVTALKGDSVDKLLELVRDKKSFDFIYVDGSHTCLDCYSDMILAWNLLRKGGVLAVDDVLFYKEKADAGDLLGYPYRATRHFLKKYEGQYKVLSDDYRLFLQKL
jgi:predicted O-methyltransferase YrrM